MHVRVELLTVGSTAHFGALVGMRGWGLSRFPALAVLIHHPKAGAILFDTGYGSRVRNGRGLGLALYRMLLPVRIGPDELIGRQLIARGVDPRKLAFIFISHAHPDHVGGLGDLPPRPVLWSRETRDCFTAGTKWSRFREGILPSLVPGHVWGNNSLIEERTAVNLNDELPGFPFGFDVVGDGSLIAVPLPGHARGQCGLLCRLEGDNLLFLIADAAWIGANVTEGANPKAILNRLIPDAIAYKATLNALRHLHQARPEIIIMPTHCSQSIEAWRSDRS